MKKAYYSAFGLFFFLFFTTICSAQTDYPYGDQASNNLPEYARLMYSQNPDIGEVVNAYEKYYSAHEFVKNTHTQYFKRLMHKISSDVNGFETGNLSTSEIEQIKRQEQEYLSRSLELSDQRSPTSVWQGIGPFDWDHDAASRSYASGAAHVYCVEQSLSNSDILYAGTATAGIWKTVDHGMNWVSVGSDLLINGVYSLEIDHSNPNVVYAQIYSNIYKTIDGGISWLPTGDAAFQGLSFQAKDIVMDPTSASVLYAATSIGFYRTADAGANWSLIVSGDFQEIEIKPDDPLTVYTVRKNTDVTEFFKSVDGAVTFTQNTLGGWPVVVAPEHQRRAELAVSSSVPENVYAYLTGEANGGSGTYGVYISTDAGENWAFTCCGPQPAGPPDLNTIPPNINMMGWSDVGSDNGGQFYYDVAFDVSPTNADSIFVGGVNHWVSGDGGATFTCPAKWSHPHKPNYIHADIHDFHYYDNGEIWTACDGGIFFSDDNGANFERRMTNIQGTDFWGFGVGFRNSDVMLGGTYHNGTLLKNGNVYLNDWLCTDGGDNYRGFVNYGKENVVYSDYNKKTLLNSRIIDIPTTGYNNKPNAHYYVGRSSKIAFDPSCYNYFYSGNGTGLWKTLDDGVSFDLIHDFGEDVADIEIAWSNPQVIYIATWTGYWDEKKLYKTVDGGITWTDITPSTSVFSSSRWIPYDIAVSYENENHIWLARTPQTSTNYDGSKVYSSIDGGATWTNITTSDLDGENLTCLVHHGGTDGGLYLGTRRAVYYKNNSMSTWALFNNGLPVSTKSTRLFVNNSDNTIINGTNRSAYKCETYQTGEPVAMISVNKKKTDCLRDTFIFYDHSLVEEASVVRNWSFPGSVWTDLSNPVRPKVLYGVAGLYSVSLDISDVFGSSSVAFTDFVEIGDKCNPDTIPGNAVLLTTTSDYVQTGSISKNTNELTISAWVWCKSTQPDYSAVAMNDGTSAGFNFREGNNTLGYHWPDGAWWWDSGLEVPIGEWSHVAMVAKSDGMRLYLNGEEAYHSFSLPAVDLTTFKIGSYKGWTSRNMSGKIDEVAMWDRALSKEEIRELRHLTHDPASFPNLFLYYQFNETGSPIYDRAGLNHATLAGNSSLITSTAPLGGGKSQTLTISAGGTYTFSDPKVVMDFPTTGTFPDGDLVVSRINLYPDSKPDENPLSRSYWVVNNYGSNQIFTALDSIKFGNVGAVGSDPFSWTLFKRESNLDGDTWGTSIGNGISSVAGADGSVTFDGNIQSFSQFVMSNGDPLPVQIVNFNAEKTAAGYVALKWVSLSEIDLESYIIERSNDGVYFEDILSERAKSHNSNIEKHSYERMDRNPNEGINYYRLRMVNIDGSEEYSSIVAVSINSTDEIFKIYPNPVSSVKHLNILARQEATVYFYDTKGSLKERIELEQGLNQIALNNFEKGSFYYSIQGKTRIQNGILEIIGD